MIVVSVVAFFVFRAASRAYKRYYERYRSQEEKILHLKALKEQYGNLSTETILKADESELLEGVALSYQLKLQKSETMEKDFSQLSDEKQYIYALDVLVQDGVKTFFKENGAILTEIIVPALKLIGLDEESEYAEKMRIMFDENDETTSINEKVINEIENIFVSQDILTNIKLCAAKYIKENAESFI